MNFSRSYFMILAALAVKLLQCSTVSASDNRTYLCISKVDDVQPANSLPEGKSECDLTHYTRSVLIHVPDNIKEGSPLVMNLHALGANAEMHQKLTNFDEIADEKGFIVVYPEGYTKQDPSRNEAMYSWNAGGCCSPNTPENPKIDDVFFLRKVVEYMKSKYSIDEERVYVTGMSNGGFMTNRVACEMSDIIAAAAPVAGPLMEDYKGDKHPFGWNADPFKCKPKNRVPILHIHSSKDLVVPFEGVEGIDEALKPSFPDFASPFIDSLSSALALAVDTDFPSVHESMKKWCKINKVKGGNSFVSEKVDRSTVCKTWAKPEKKSKDNFAPVKLCVIDSPHPFGSGHCWPGKHLDWADLPREILAKLARSFFLSIKDKFKLLEEFFSDDIIGNPVGQCWNDKVNNEYIWDFFIQFRRKADGKLIMAGDINSEEL